MTTWAPVPDDLDRNFAVLDVNRLNAQRGLEGVILMRTALSRLEGGTYGWRYHPASTMWIGHDRALAEYLVRAAREWRSRGYQDGCLPEYVEAWERLPDTGWPPWWGDHAIHARHRTWLLLRRPQHYNVQPEFAGEVDIAWDWMHEHDVDTEPELTWPTTDGSDGSTTRGEGPSPGADSRRRT